MDIKKSGFTIIEMVVVLGIAVALMSVLGGMMVQSFQAKNKSNLLESVANEANTVLAQLNKNMLDASGNSFICPTGVGTSVSFETRTGGSTTLFCDEINSKIASISAQSGTFNLLNSGVSVRNCASFATCVLDTANEVVGVNFNIEVGKTGGEGGDQFWNFVNKVAVR